MLKKIQLERCDNCGVMTSQFVVSADEETVLCIDCNDAAVARAELSTNGD